MELPIAVPSNEWLQYQPDRQWTRTLWTVLAAASLLLLAVAMVGWPRLRSTSLSYDILHLREEVRVLERFEQRLTVELEELRSPARLGVRARTLGLTPPDLSAVFAAPFTPTAVPTAADDLASAESGL